MDDCIFCKIASGEFPATKIYEDDDYLSFLDIQPVNLGHALVVPKTHHEKLAETPDQVVAGLFPLVKRIAAALIEATEAPGYNVIVNNAPEAGQVVMHTHIHIVPRFDEDGLRHWPKRDVAEGDSARVAEAVRRALQ